MPIPACQGDWQGLARVAATIRDDRARRDPELVAAGKMPPATADRRIRIASALAELWQTIAARAALPDVETRAIETRFAEGAAHSEIRADLKETIVRARAALDKDPGSRRKRAMLDGVEALLWQHQPYDGCDGEPRILFIAELNAQLRHRERATCQTKAA